MANLKHEIYQAKIKLEQLQQEYHAISPIAANKEALKNKLREIDEQENNLTTLEDQYNEND